MFENSTSNIRLTKEELIRILDNVFGNVFVTDGSGKLIFINTNSAGGLGFSRDQLLDKTIYELLDEGIMKRSVTDEAIQKRKTVAGYALTGNNLGLATISKPLLDEDGNVIMVVTYSQETPLMDSFLGTINKEKQEKINYKHALEYLSTAKMRKTTIVANNEAMRKIFATADLVSKTDSTVIIYGESGVGKEIIATYIHQNSMRSKEPYIPVNCAAIPSELMESEFFGYVGGAFTSANKEGSPGLFELANKGTLFLDEVAELSLDMQAKLLRVLETGEVRRLGSTEASKKMNVRVVAATNKDLRRMVDEKTFREDLYYRLDVIPIVIPPLRERKDEIPYFANIFLDEYNRKYSFDKRISQELMNDFVDYCWPGNIRELRNVVERLVITSDSPVLTHFNDIGSRPRLDVKASEAEQETTARVETDPRTSLKLAVDSYEYEYIKDVLKKHNGNVTKASKELGIHRSVLYKKMKKQELT